jgi:hypothetical protein
MNIIKAFRKDLAIAVDSSIKNPNKNRLIYFAIITFGYLYGNAIFKYSIDYRHRLQKIQNLKREGKYILE